MLLQHRDDTADDLEVTQFFRRDVQEHVLAAGIDFGKALREIAHGGG